MAEGSSPVDANASLTARTVRGLGWTIGTLAATALLQVVYTAVISRLLEPADFGIMAAALLALRFITYFSQIGIASAVVQRPTLSRADQLSALRIAAIAGTAGGAIVVALAPLFASLVRMPESVDVIRWMGLTIPSGTVGGVLGGLLRRELRFAAFGVTTTGSYVIGFLGVGIGTALAGWGVWSLVAAHVSQQLVQLALGGLMVRPPVLGGGSRDGAREMLRFGGGVSVTGFLEFLTSNLHSIAVGRYISPAGLGQYSRANLLISLPVENVAAAISRVLLPGLSQVQRDPARFAPALALGISLQAPIVVTGAVAIAAAAPAIVPLLLGPGWDEAAAVLPMLCVGHTLGLLTNPIAVGAEAMGLIGRKLAIQLASTVTVAALIAAVVATGATLTRIAAAWAAAELVRHLCYWIFIVPDLGLVRRAVVGRYLVAGMFAVAAAAPLVVTSRLTDLGDVTALVSGGVAGGIICGLLMVVGPGRGLVRDVSALRSRLRHVPTQ